MRLSAPARRLPGDVFSEPLPSSAASSRPRRWRAGSPSSRCCSRPREGTFLTGSAVFFTEVVGLRAAQVGLGLTVAGIVSFLVALPRRASSPTGSGRSGCGRSARLWQATMFAAWPFIDGFAGYLAMVGLLRDRRERRRRRPQRLHPRRDARGGAGGKSQAYMYSALNVGFTLGAIIGGIALAFDNVTVMRWMPLFTAGHRPGQRRLRSRGCRTRRTT